MAITAPTLKEIQSQVVSDISTKTSQTIPLLSKAVWRVWGFALAGIWIILFKFGTDAYKQRFAQTANRQFLILLGELIGITIQPATIWDGEADVVSTTAVGTLDAGTQLVNNNTGVVYTVTTTITKTVGTLTFKLSATQGGEIGDLQVSDILDFVSPQPGLENTATISLVNTSGENEEDLEVYRGRVIDGYQKKPQGGAEADYELWGEEAPNVINIYPYAAATPGQVDVYVEVDNQTDGIPTAQQLIDTEVYINFDPVTGKKTRRPVTAEVNMFPITRIVFDVNITGLSPDTPDNRATILSAITQNLLAKEPYIQGLSITRNDTISRAEMFSLVQVTAAALGATVSAVTIELLSVLIDLHVLGAGEKSKVGTVTYI
jgi:uncharacterized phage protein gp47/JayE